jgi:hypothetical protein
MKNIIIEKPVLKNTKLFVQKMKCNINPIRIQLASFWKTVSKFFLTFYLPHMEYEGSIGFVMRKIKKNYY